MGNSDDELNEENEISDEGEDEGRSGYRKGGYHPVSVEEKYNNNQYLIVKKLGWGHFSTVWLAEDLNNNKQVALKFVKSAENYRDAAIDEIELLKCVAKNDPKGKRNVVQFFGDFEHKGPNGSHIVMVFEVLGNNLLNLIEKFETGLPIEVVKSITKQILVALNFLHNSCQIIHTDLKPENILLEKVERNPRTKKQFIKRVKIADLGNACWVNKHFTDDIQTRQYRSPEVIIGARYDCSADIWSLGCIVFEMITGDLLFKPKKGDHYSKSEDHVALIFEILKMDRCPSSMLEGLEPNKSAKFFNSHRELRNIKKLRFWTLEQVLREKYEMQKSKARELSKFLGLMLKFKPDKRATASELLDHAWLDGVDEDLEIPVSP